MRSTSYEPSESDPFDSPGPSQSKTDRKSILQKDEENIGIVRSNSVSSAESRGLVRRLSSSITNLTGKLSRSKTVSHGSRNKPAKKKTQADKDIDAMNELVQSMKS